MTDELANLQRSISQQRLRLQSVSDRVRQNHQTEIDSWKEEIRQAIVESVESLQKRADELSGGHEFCRDVLCRAGDYLQWMQWSLWDIPYFAVAIKPDRSRFRSAVGSCAFVYFAGRMVDDFLDRHHLYRGRETLLGNLSQDRGTAEQAESLTIVVALMVYFEGLSTDGSPASAKTQSQMIGSMRRLLVGILMEFGSAHEWGDEFYERLIRLKNVDYWRLIYTSLDPDWSSSLYPFLCDYFALAQKLNDVQDFARDQTLGRPNLVSMLRSEKASNSLMDSVSLSLGKDLLALGDQAEKLDEPARSIAEAKLSESLEEAYRLGLFKEAPPPPTEERPNLDLLWHSNLSEFVDRLGPDILEETDCPVCHASESSLVFRKQEFEHHRCRQCSHIYVNPRLQSEIPERVAVEIEGRYGDPFLESQKIYADYLCRLIRQRAAGPRLLDVGFGRGYLMRMARAHGFQVYGAESSELLAGEMESAFDRRVERSSSPNGLPWGSFDVIVMNHVLEHLARPSEMLDAIHQALNPDGIFYVAVPDSDSLQFKIFGKEWDAVNPVGHFQFFNYASLSKLLLDNGFDTLTKVDHPPLTGKWTQRWMRKFRELGGDELGEVAIIARANS